MLKCMLGYIIARDAVNPGDMGARLRVCRTFAALHRDAQLIAAHSDTMASALSMRTFVPVRTARPVARPSLRARRVVAMAAPTVSAAAGFVPMLCRFQCLSITCCLCSSVVGQACKATVG